ncbi:MAG TPA: toll/interleukin-1 receptor domain-containing protein, partial [Myxococcales bacterium]|nr:toll/interleukin-1 receptor domain-containing protein [Myxococcales bacterium]
MFDVFLSHNSKDKPAVEAIAARLRAEAGIEPFLDKWHLVPGEAWQPALEKALEASTTVAVFIGPSGISPWHNEEVRAALNRAVRTKDEYRVIPVLLPESTPDAVQGFLAERTWVDFRAGLDKEEPFQRLVTGIKGVARTNESFELPDEPAPYRGLFKFEREHADRFFGRENEVALVLKKLEKSSFVAVVGASGAGKSSLVLAGVLPKLEQQFKSWPAPIRTFVLTPGANPLRALADQIVTLLPLADRVRCADEYEQRMRQRPDGLRTAVKTLTTEKPGSIVLVVDQLEELFTHATERDGAESIKAFAANVRDLAENGSGQARVLATVRADFFDRCLSVESLCALLQDRSVYLGPMTISSLRDVIVRPAASVGALFEAGVVSAFMKELERRPGILPLLEHALDSLWRHRKGVWLTSAAYDAMGGVSGALKKHADECWERIAEADRPVARDVLLRLVSLGEGVPDTRRRVKVEDLYPVGVSWERVDRVLQKLSGADARLLVVDHREAEVAHEVLIQEWATLRDWVDGARRELKIHRRVTEVAREWADNGRADGFWLTGARLLEARGTFGPG